MEELKLIVEAISGLGADGKEAFIYYLLSAEVLPYVVGTMALIMLYLTIKRIISVVIEENREDRDARNT